jgi:PST family polysaccharide transporter
MLDATPALPDDLAGRKPLVLAQTAPLAEIRALRQAQEAEELVAARAGLIEPRFEIEARNSRLARLQARDVPTITGEATDQGEPLELTKAADINEKLAEITNDPADPQAESCGGSRCVTIGCSRTERAIPYAAGRARAAVIRQLRRLMMFEAKTRRNFGFYLAFHVMRYAFPLIVTPFLAHYLMKTGFGQYAVINSCVWSTVIFMDFGFYIYGINRIAYADTIDEINREASAIVGAKIVLIPVCLIAYATLIKVSGVFFESPIASVLGALTAVGYGGTFSWYFQGRQRGGTAVIIEGAPQVIQLCLILMLIRTPSDLWIVILIQAQAPLMSVVLSVIIMRREGIRLRIRIWSSQVVVALRGAKPFFVERICFSFYTALTPTIVAMLAGVQAAAIYSIADRVNIFLGSLAIPVAQTMVPVLTKVAKQDRSSWEMTVVVASFTIGFCGMIACIVYLSIGIIIGIFFSQAYQAAIPTARIFCIAAFISSIAAALSNFVIIPRGASSILVWSALTALCVSLLLQFCLIPRYGPAGGAIARVGAELVTTIILSVRAVRLFWETRTNRIEAAL